MDRAFFGTSCYGNGHSLFIHTFGGSRKKKAFLFLSRKFYGCINIHLTAAILEQQRSSSYFRNLFCENIVQESKRNELLLILSWIFQWAALNIRYLSIGSHVSPPGRSNCKLHLCSI
ncbi:uncharacterized protein LOC128249403 [Octopus bimaculoides]|uniref:uncharacterized protein LOC128249403 n=1 Tax=Octopus bimaculoides TaxID=37653 RepID=UPI0022E1FEC1|nr:uncharacterized protein LOC128249403 [Octopus bimaculoides]